VYAYVIKLTAFRRYVHVVVGGFGYTFVPTGTIQLIRFGANISNSNFFAPGLGTQNTKRNKSPRAVYDKYNRRYSSRVRITDDNILYGVTRIRDDGVVIVTIIYIYIILNKTREKKETTFLLNTTRPFHRYAVSLQRKRYITCDVNKPRVLRNLTRKYDHSVCIYTRNTL